MLADHAEYLASVVLNEGNTVTYRSISRALKVHSNLAKQILYEYYQSQNSKKPGSLYATYLLTGTQKATSPSSTADGVKNEDEANIQMHSSPLPASSAPQAQLDGQQEESSTKLVTLAKEEDLDAARSGFDDLLSIHVYSLAPGPIKDLEILADCNRKVAAEFASEDPLEVWKQYGVVQNRHVKRRTTRRPPPSVAPTTAKLPTKLTSSTSIKQETGKTTSTMTEATSTTSIKPVEVSDSNSSKATPELEQKPKPATVKSGTAKPPQMKREVSSIFKSFAKSKPKTPKQTTDESPTPTSEAQTPVEDEQMGGLSDEEAGDEDAAMLDEGALDKPVGKSKKDREEELRKMMEADDDPMEDAPAEAQPEDIPESAPETDKVESQPSEDHTEPAESMTVSDGRRRGRRRVMKKKTVKDEEGYLVTREEAAWESFSEDEPAPKKPKISAPAPAATKSKKGAAKAGQGSIMSFFKKT